MRTKGTFCEKLSGTCPGQTDIDDVQINNDQAHLQPPYFTDRGSLAHVQSTVGQLETGTDRVPPRRVYPVARRHVCGPSSHNFI